MLRLDGVVDGTATMMKFEVCTIAVNGKQVFFSLVIDHIQ
jgi:hypothetical protein